MKRGLDGERGNEEKRWIRWWKLAKGAIIGLISKTEFIRKSFTGALTRENTGFFFFVEKTFVSYKSS